MDTNNNNNIDSLELEEMRKQMADIKAQLDQQLFINDKQMKKIMMEKTKSINNYGTSMLCIGIVSIIIFIPELYIFGFSLVFCISSAILMLADAYNDYYSAHKFKANMLTENSVHKNLEILVGMKQYNRKSFIIGMVVVVVWMAWTAVEFFNCDLSIIIDFIIKAFNLPATDSALKNAVLKGGCIGAAIGGIVGGLAGTYTSIKLYKKQQKNITDIIDAISEEE